MSITKKYIFPCLSNMSFKGQARYRYSATVLKASDNRSDAIADMHLATMKGKDLGYARTECV